MNELLFSSILYTTLRDIEISVKHRRIKLLEFFSVSPIIWIRRSTKQARDALSVAQCLASSIARFNRTAGETM